MKKVCAVIVTYNRKEYLLKLIKSLINQTYKLDSILIFDNFGSDNTGEYLKENNIINDYRELKLTKNSFQSIDIYFYRNNENTGGSGGFHDSMKIACELNKKFDFLWCMDDDVLADTECLNNLINKTSKNILMAVPNRNNEKFVDRPIVDIDLTNPFRIRKIKKSLNPNTIKNDSVEVVDVAFEGPLISVELIKKIGYMDVNYFIFFDDTDFSHRACKYTKIIYCMNAHLYKQIIPQKNGNKNYNWRDYYMIRNRIVFDRKYSNNFLVKYVRPLLYALSLCIKNILIQNFKNINVVKKAYNDAVKENLGKVVDPAVGFKNEK